jgi:hypothetical protein
MTLVGRTALSVESSTKWATPWRPAASNQQARAGDVVEHRLARRRFQQRHVLVRRRVQHHFRVVRGEQRLDAHRVAEIAHDRVHADVP